MQAQIMLCKSPAHGGAAVGMYGRCSWVAWEMATGLDMYNNADVLDQTVDVL
jgi:hypothetical protein